MVLHARTDAIIRASVRGGSLLVEVGDGSPVLPAPRAPDVHSPTGRGLALVEALSTAWGAVPTASGGKVIWFELGEGHDQSVIEAAAAPDDDASVRLLGVPVLLALATLDHGAAVRRELDLDSLSGASHRELSVNRYVDVTGIRSALEASCDDGLYIVDIEFTVADRAASAALNHLALVEEGDRRSQDGELLVAPSIPEVAQCRHWLLTEISWQLKGAAPTPWQAAAEPIEHLAPLVPLDPRLARDLSAGTGAVVLADGDNRILHLDAEAEELFGWTSAELRGRRLTLLIPPQLRDAHLAGFMRHAVVGVGPMLGVPVTVPALHRDGTEIEVELLVEQVSEPSGRRLYRGTLTRTS